MQICNKYPRASPQSLCPRLQTSYWFSDLCNQWFIKALSGCKTWPSWWIAHWRAAQTFANQCCCTPIGASSKCWREWLKCWWSLTGSSWGPWSNWCRISKRAIWRIMALLPYTCTYPFRWSHWSHAISHNFLISELSQCLPVLQIPIHK